MVVEVEAVSCTVRYLPVVSPRRPVRSSDVCLRHFSETCRRHHVIVLSDEIYGRLTFDSPHVSMAKVSRDPPLVPNELDTSQGRCCQPVTGGDRYC